MNFKPTKPRIMQLLAIDILLFFALNVFSQTDSIAKSEPHKVKYEINLNLFTPLDVENPRYRMGIGFVKNPNVQYIVECAFGHEKMTPYNFDIYKNYLFTELQGEIRFRNRFVKDSYIAYDLFFQYVEKHLEDDVYVQFLDLYSLSYLDSDYESSRCGIKTIIGYSPYTNHWGFDVYMGFGLRFMWNSFFNTHYYPEYEMSTKTNNNKAYWSGFQLGYTIAAGVKVFYLF